MNAQDVQSVILTAPDGPAVAHQVLTVYKGHDGQARQALQALMVRQDAKGAKAVDEEQGVHVSFGVRAECEPCVSIGVTFAGLVALGLPDGYQRVIRRLAPAFEAGAVRRSPQCGDNFTSAPAHWKPQFAQEAAHVLVTWHGSDEQVRRSAAALLNEWPEPPNTARLEQLHGHRLGHPEGEEGEWVHFGFRDHLSELDIDGGPRGGYHQRRNPVDLRTHAPGALLLGEVNDAGFNSFPLTRAPQMLRDFFANSSFGVLRYMQQDVQAFEDAVDCWAQQLGAVMDLPNAKAFVKAKLCGRWPNGRVVRPGEFQPQGAMQLDLSGDTLGEGCPFGSHVRRMRDAPDVYGRGFLRPLQRRSFPFGPVDWADPTAPTEEPRGQLGHFFCASIEEQFEHLMGQWAVRTPLGLPPGETASDPLMGTRPLDTGTLEIPLRGRPTQRLSGFGGWTRHLGSLYAWYPGRSGLAALLDQTYSPPENEHPWL